MRATLDEAATDCPLPVDDTTAHDWDVKELHTDMIDVGTCGVKIPALWIHAQCYGCELIVSGHFQEVDTDYDPTLKGQVKQ